MHNPLRQTETAHGPNTIECESIEKSNKYTFLFLVNF